MVLKFENVLFDNLFVLQIDENEVLSCSMDTRLLKNMQYEHTIGMDLENSIGTYSFIECTSLYIKMIDGSEHIINFGTRYTAETALNYIFETMNKRPITDSLFRKGL